VFAPRALLVEQPAQLIYRVTGHCGLVGSNGIVAMMSMAAWRPIDSICKMNELMRNRHLNRCWLHIRLDENKVSMTA